MPKLEEPVSFTVRSDVDDFAGGQLAVGPDGEAFDLGKAVKDGGGTITTDDSVVADELARLTEVFEQSSGAKRNPKPAAVGIEPPSGKDKK